MFNLEDGAMGSSSSIMTESSGSSGSSFSSHSLLNFSRALVNTDCNTIESCLRGQKKEEKSNYISSITHQNIIKSQDFFDEWT